MSSQIPVPITVTIAETETVLPDGSTFAALRVDVIDAAGAPWSADAALTVPDTYAASFAGVAPGAGSITISAFDAGGVLLGTALTLPYSTTKTPQTYPQATGITVTSP